jgi:serine/threonine-protein kinase
MIGKTIGKYRFVAPLGRGGMGTVFRAVDETLDREVAIKVLNPDLADSEVMKRFRAEAVTLAKLNHPDLATIYELYRSEGELLMVMEFVRGETLDQVLDRCGPLPLEQAVSIVERLLGALEHAHRAGIVHRDLKPANVMVTVHGGVKIMDFGVARVIGADNGTKDGFLIGTPSYMSPEQVLGHDVDGRADLYSVGVMFYRLLTGALPFMADTIIAMAEKQVFDKPPPLDLYRQGLPEWSEAIVRRALAKAPADRFQTAEEFRAELARGMGTATSEHVSSKTAGATGPQEVQAPMPAAAPTVVLPKKRFAPSGLYLTTAAMAVCVLAMFAYLQTETAAPAVPHNPVPELIVAGTSAARHARLPDYAQIASQALAEHAISVEPAERTAATPLPPLMFDARALVDDGDRQRERRAKVLLTDKMLTVTADNEQMVLLTLPYRRLVSLNYSRGKDPLWRSPSGPVVIARVKAGTFGFLKGDRHWIALRTQSRFIVLRVNEEQVQPVLGALEERTGQKAEHIVERGVG